jgi:hypothetical protein
MSTKVQDPPGIVKVERTHQVFTPHTSKSTTLIRTDVNH